MEESSLGPCVLEGKFIRLEPLRASHANSLTRAAEKLDFGWSYTPLHSREDVDKRIESTLELERKGQAYTFAVFAKPESRVVGSTSYFQVSSEHKRAEIGYTWYEQSLWGSYVNPESKYLLLQHAFEDWHAIRIQLSTDAKNVHSQKAIVKLGARFEGTLRNHMIRRDGTLRDTMLYSITSTEWPQVKGGLENRIRQFSKQ